MEISSNEKNGFELYQKLYNDSIHPETREKFWEEQASKIYWEKKPSKEKILDESKKPFYRWFKDGLTNICYNCIDRHIENGKGNNKAIIWESAYLKEGKEYTYNELYLNVNKFSKILLDNGINKGDTVIIYMPMIAESLFAMLACARVGAIHSVVFGGFAAPELADRIKDAKPKLIITGAGGLEPRKHIEYFPIVQEAVDLALDIIKLEELKIILVLRPNEFVVKIENFEIGKITKIYQDEMAKIPDDVIVKPVFVETEHPLYILYTSGTTGSPKGIVRDTGGTCVALNYTMEYIMDIGSGDIVASTSDIGWVVGHTFIVYGPLIRNATTVVYEGKPVGTHHCAKIWEIIEKYKVKAFYTSPTALRAVKREDHEHKEMKKYNISSLHSIHMAGERCDPDTVIWLREGVGENILINDQWWQTESGWPICCNNIKMHRFKTIPGCACRPQLGYDIKILDEKTNEIISKPETLGKICIKLPMPPSFMLTLWGHDEAFLKKYISDDKEYYISGDCGYFDREGYIFIMTRLDDMIKVAGHRLSTGRMEEALNKLSEVSESAVIATFDELKGELPFAFLICRKDIDIDNQEINKKITELAKAKIVHEIGAISRLKDAIICHRLPKTRSGKIIRGLLKSIVNQEEYKVPATIEDESVIQEVINLLKAKHVIK